MVDERNPNEEKPVADEGGGETVPPHPIEIAHNVYKKRVEVHPVPPIIKRQPVIFVTEFWQRNSKGQWETVNEINEEELVAHWLEQQKEE